MADLNGILEKAKELHWGIQSLLRLSTANEYDDLMSGSVNRGNPGGTPPLVQGVSSWESANVLPA